MKEKISPFLKKLESSNAIQMQYRKGLMENELWYNDPLMEEKHEKVKGLIHKYKNRALIKISYLCAAHCRFCTRIRQIGDKTGTLQAHDIDPIISYLQNHPEIDDVILSGGDPLFTPKITHEFLKRIATIDSIKTLRIGTRLPFHAPEAFKSNALNQLLNTIDDIGKEKPFFILLHIEHPDELVNDSIEIIKKLRGLKVSLLSQSVFLKGINIEEEILYKLFKSLYHLGVIPYYIYHCDPVKGLERFCGDKEQEKLIIKNLRMRLSGIACPLFVEEKENSYGKIPVF